MVTLTRFSPTAGLLMLVGGFALLGPASGEAKELEHQDLQAESSAQHGAIEDAVSDLSLDLHKESEAIQNEFAAQHGLIQDNLQADIADLKSDIATLQETVDQLGQGGQATPCGAGTEGLRFVVSADNKEVCDNTSGLVWEKSPSSNTVLVRPWRVAVNWCSNLGKGWHLPNIKEFLTLADFSQSNLALPPNHPFDNVVHILYWSGTTRTNPSSDAWYINLFEGQFFPRDKSGNFGVWCVRYSRQ